MTIERGLQATTIGIRDYGQRLSLRPLGGQH
jgi:hypothetical protein